MNFIKHFHYHCFTVKTIEIIYMKYFRLVICFIIYLCFSYINAQTIKQWPMGPFNYAIDFNQSKNDTFSTGLPLYTLMVGTTSMSDLNGNLICYGYPDGIYNKYHQLVLSLFDSMTIIMNIQKVLIVPVVNQPLKFYIFKAKRNYSDSTVKGLRYYIIDFSKNDSGKVIQSETILNSETLGFVIAVNKPNGYWIVTRSLDSLWAYPVTASGLGSPIKSTISHALKRFYNFSSLYVKASHDGKMLLMRNADNELIALRFDPISGKVSKSQNYKFGEIMKGDTDRWNYYDPNQIISSDFSPNDSIIYLTLEGSYKVNSKRNKQQRLLQIKRYPEFSDYDKNFNELDVFSYADAKLGPDGRLYVGGNTAYTLPYPTISVITRPDEWGYACKPQHTKFFLPPSGSTVGSDFPNTIDTWHMLKFTVEQSCGDTAIFWGHTDTSWFKTLIWYLPNGDSLVTASPAGINFTIPHSGKFYFKLKGITSWGYTQWYTDSVDLYKIANIKPNLNIHYTPCSNGKVLFNCSVLNRNDTTGMSYRILWEASDGGFRFHDSIPSGTDSFFHVFATGKHSIMLDISDGFCRTKMYQDLTIGNDSIKGFTLSDTIGCIPFNIQILDSVPSIYKTFYTLTDGNQSIQINATQPITNYTFTQAGHWFVIQQIIDSVSGCVYIDTQSVFAINKLTLQDSVSIIKASYNEFGDSINIVWHTLPNASFYNIYINTQLITTTNDSIYSFFVDTNLTNKAFSIYITATDYCKNNTTPSAITKPIILSATNIDNNYSLIRYSPYCYWQAAVNRYEIQCKKTYEVNWENIATFSDTVLYKHLDYLDINDSSSIGKTYRIKAYMNNDSSIYSLSNQTFVPYVPTVFIPNAFTPNADHLNDKFAPICFGVDSWQLTIYDRWGQLVFSGNQTTGGWDGLIQSSKSKNNNSFALGNQLYIYVLSYQGNKSKTYAESESISGEVLLLLR